MANETTMTVRLNASKGGATVDSGSKQKQLTMAGSKMVQTVIEVGTGASGELLTLGDIAGVPAAVMITNMDATNYVLVSGETNLTAVMQLKIVAGASVLFTPLAATLYAKANGAACNIQVIAVEA